MRSHVPTVPIERIYEAFYTVVSPRATAIERSKTTHSANAWAVYLLLYCVAHVPPLHEKRNANQPAGEQLSIDSLRRTICYILIGLPVVSTQSTFPDSIRNGHAVHERENFKSNKKSQNDMCTLCYSAQADIGTKYQYTFIDEKCDVGSTYIIEP